MLQLVLPLGKAFVVGGIFCAIGQILIDKTKLTPAKILVIYVVAGVALGAVGAYEPLVNWAGGGATVPITGFGAVMAQGAREAVQEKGILGIFSGPITAGAAGIGVAVLFGYLAAVLFRPKDKS